MKDPYYELPFVSQSTLKLFMKSPAEYKYRYVDRAWRETPMPTTMLGSLVHCKLLEPEKVDKSYMYFSEEDRPDTTKTFAAGVNKKWKQTLEEQAATHKSTLVTKQLWETSDKMLEVLRGHWAYSYFEDPEPEEPLTCYRELDVLWQSTVSDLPLKSKLDIVHVELHTDMKTGIATIVDYKSTSAITLQEFGYSVKKYGYDIQAAFYKDAATCWLEEHYPGIDFDVQVLFVPQKSSLPFQVLGVVELDNETMLAAKSTYEYALQELEGCLHTGIWDTVTGVQTLNLSKPASTELDVAYTPEDWF